MDPRFCVICQTEFLPPEANSTQWWCSDACYAEMKEQAELNRQLKELDELGGKIRGVGMVEMDEVEQSEAEKARAFLKSTPLNRLMEEARAERATMGPLVFPQTSTPKECLQAASHLTMAATAVSGLEDVYALTSLAIGYLDRVRGTLEEQLESRYVEPNQDLSDSDELPSGPGGGSGQEGSPGVEGLPATLSGPV